MLISSNLLCQQIKTRNRFTQIALPFCNSSRMRTKRKYPYCTSRGVCFLQCSPYLRSRRLVSTRPSTSAAAVVTFQAFSYIYTTIETWVLVIDEGCPGILWKYRETSSRLLLLCCCCCNPNPRKSNWKMIAAILHSTVLHFEARKRFHENS